MAGEISRIKVGEETYNIKATDSNVVCGVLGEGQSVKLTGGLVFVIVGDLYGGEKGYDGCFVCTKDYVTEIEPSNIASVTASGNDYTIKTTTFETVLYIAIINEQTG